MSHILVTLHGLEKDIVESMLHEHTRKKTFDGVHLEHIWENLADDEEIILLFRTDEGEKVVHLLEKIHEDVVKYHPDITPPEIIFLKK